MRKGNDKLTISVSKEVKDRFKHFCDSEGLKLGKQIELFMFHELETRSKKK